MHIITHHAGHRVCYRSVVIDLFVLCSYSVYILLNILPAHLFNQIESVFTINSVLLGLHIICMITKLRPEGFSWVASFCALSSLIRFCLAFNASN